jgi:hypothetical protein
MIVIRASIDFVFFFSFFFVTLELCNFPTPYYTNCGSSMNLSTWIVRVELTKGFNFFYIFLIRLVGCGVQLGPLDTAATDWPIVPAPVDYDDGEFGGMKIGKGNRSTLRKRAPAPLCPTKIPLDHRRGGKPATNRLSYGAAKALSYFTFIIKNLLVKVMSKNRLQLIRSEL